MFALGQAREALDAVDLREGLSVGEVQRRLQLGLRLKATGLRVLAFYLVEMAHRRLHQASGHSSAVHFARDRLDMQPRRTRELIAVGRKLLTLPEIDRAFCDQRIGWSKLLLLTRVASPEHEAAWLARALEMSCKQLALEVRLSRPGRAPRKPGEHSGLPEVRFEVRTSVDALTHQKLELAKQKLSAERGTPVGDAEMLDVMAELLLSTDEDGTVPGRTRVDASIYRIVVRPGAEDSLHVETEDGPVPVEAAGLHEDCIRCDAHVDGELDRKTPPAMRRRVIARDGNRCRCCGSRRRLMAHHIQYRSKGGRTVASNLVTLCVDCHSLVHADLLVLEGAHADQVRFVDASGSPLHESGAHAESQALLRLSKPEPSDPGPAAIEDPVVTLDLVTLETVPDVVDGAWLQRHDALLRLRADKSIELVPGVVTSVPLTPRQSPAPDDDAFAGILGQDALVARLEATAQGSCARSRSFPHTLFVGPPGTGKSTLARAVAARVGANLLEGNLLEGSGPLVQDARAILRLLAAVRSGDVLFLDEVHAVPRAVLEVLYQALAERRVALTLHTGTRVRTVVFDLPSFTLVAATTEDDRLPDALVSRFGLRESLGYYDVADLTAIVGSVASAHDLAFEDEDAARRLAEHARGTPREALRLMERVLDTCALGSTSVIASAQVDVTLERLGYDSAGLDPLEQRYTALLHRSGEPIALERMARLLGTTSRKLARDVEPFLFRSGVVRMTARGRMAARRPRLLEA